MASDAGGHTEFYDMNSVSLRNQAAVVAGKYGKVELE